MASPRRNPLQNPTYVPPTAPPRASTMERRKGLFGSIKDKLSKDSESSNPRSPHSPNNSPFSTAPPTRRPDRPGMNAFTTPSNEPPPAYTPNPPQPMTNNTPTTQFPATTEAVPAPGTQNQGDDQFAFLSTFDTVFLIDDSGSMAGRSWRECSLALETITPICTRYDQDGIDIHFLNAPSQPFFKNVADASTVHEIFSTVRPSGSTPTGQRLNAILKPYLRQLEQNPDSCKPMNVIVITDGVPSDDVESVLINTAKKLDRLDAEPWQVGVQFFQTGNEPGASEYLEGLDDELSRMGGGCRDIVDTVPFQPGPNGRGVGLTGEGILKIVLGAVNKRLDRRQNPVVNASG